MLLSNGQKVKVTILTSDQTEDVLEVPKLLCWVGPAPPAEFCGFPHVQEFSQPGSTLALPATSLPESRVVLGGLKSSGAEKGVPMCSCPSLGPTDVGRPSALSWWR